MTNKLLMFVNLLFLLLQAFYLEGPPATIPECLLLLEAGQTVVGICSDLWNFSDENAVPVVLISQQ